MVLLVAVPLGQQGQANRGSSSPQVSNGPKIAGDASDYLYDLDPDLRHRMMVSRREEMKRRMVDNASRLLEMSRQLDADLQGHEPTQADARRLDDIAKLARAVRDQMRQ